ncbi:MAG: hypothetical protein U0984_11050 [Prosthecobacter sp.]|nr:hypothetical protein [Prosthecobacter sp.]
MNRHLLHLLLVLLSVCSPLLGQEPPASAASPEAIAKIQEAQELSRRERFVDALAKLDEAEALSPNIAQIYNLRGSIYLSRPLRDFALATEMFNKAEALLPGTIVVAFNRAEVFFVKQDWPAAQKAFQKVLDDFQKIPVQTRHIILFKRLIAEAKLGQNEAAEKTLKDSFTFMDDTPAYYYAKAALAFQAKDEAKAKEWMAKAAGIFKAADVAPYLDSLTEARWIPDISLPLLETK